MAGFPLLYLNPTNLEKIISKLEEKSYCRLQETCRDLKDFIGSNQKISVILDGKFHMQASNVMSIIRETESMHEYENYISKVDLEGFYGTRLALLSITEKLQVKQLCTLMVKHRITCNRLILKSYVVRDHLTTLLDVLKPIEIDIHCCNDNFEALVESKTLKKVRVGLDVNAAVDATPKFLASFEEVRLDVGLHKKEQFNELKAVLQGFLSQFCPNLRRFEFSVAWRIRPGPSEAEWKQIFYGLRLTEAERSRREVVFILDDLPQHFLPESLVQFIIMPQGAGRCQIRFIRNHDPAR